jgi:hypothetical protein
MTLNDSANLHDCDPKYDQRVVACEKKHRNSTALRKWFWLAVLCVSMALLILVLKA